MRNSAATAAVRRRLAEAEAVIAKRWLERVTEVLGEEIKRHPDGRAVMIRLAGLLRGGAGDPRPGDDVAALIMRAVREVDPAIADAVERRLGMPIAGASHYV